jgi:hypothetical protein
MRMQNNGSALMKAGSLQASHLNVMVGSKFGNWHQSNKDINSRTVLNVDLFFTGANFT